MRVVKLRGFEALKQHSIIDTLNGLCRDEPLSVHCYAVYYLTAEPERTDIILLASNNDVNAYALVRYGGRFTIEDVYEVYLWNPVKEVVRGVSISPGKRADIQLQDSISNNDVGVVTERFKELGFRRFNIEEFHDMVCTRNTFKPSPLEGLAVKLGEEHAPLYRDLEVERGVELSIGEAREILKTYTHYGVIVGNVLASIAARYVTLPHLHVIGGVFTRREYRGRGYAKAAVSALTREAVDSRATAGLHAEVDNKPAIRVYKSLGYEAVRTRTWIFAHP